MNQRLCIELIKKIRMRVTGILWLEDIVEKLLLKHSIETQEVVEVLENKPAFRFVEKGHKKGEDVYMALGQTEAGRYLVVFFIHKDDNQALILSARDMSHKERRYYEKK